MKAAELLHPNHTNTILPQMKMQNILLNPSYRTNFLVCVGNQYKRVHTSEISFFYAEGNIVYLVKKDNKKMIIDFTLDQIISEVDLRIFFRVNRSIIVCSSCIDRIHKYFNSRLKLEITPQHTTEVLVTRSRVTDFLSWLNY